MYKIGYYDDENRQYEAYKQDFSLHELDLIKIENVFLKSDLRKYVLENKLDAIIIDYCLDKFTKTDFKDGNELIRYLNVEIMDFPTIILTAYPSESKNEKTVANSLIFDRDILTSDTDSIRYKGFVDQIINTVEVFHERMKVNLEEFNSLFYKRKGKGLSTVEEDRLIQLYKVLLSYDLIDEINPELLRRDIVYKMDVILSELVKRIDE